MNKNDDHINENEAFDLLLLQWMDGELSGQALSDFESNPRFEEYRMIADSASKIKIPAINEGALLSKINKQINSKAKPTKSIPLWKKMGSIAAILVVVLGAVMFFNSGVKVDSYHAIQLSHALPDGSQVILNSNSELSYSNSFTEERLLNLEGEAFFEVEKGKSFTVSTDLGDVKVLGTSFNVLAREDIFTVACRTGKVQVTVDGKNNILNPGDRIRFNNGTSNQIEKIDPTKINEWAKGESFFERSPLQDVISAISNKYDIKILLPTRYNDKLYTGSFIHHDIEKALKMVLVPMGVKYELDGETVNFK